MNPERLNAATRVALAAYLHDLGKFAERARIAEAEEKDAAGVSRAEREKQLNCPSFKGRSTHVHAAYTAIGFDLLEAHLPELVGDVMTPFAPWGERNADDSIINAAARHHRPDTFLQWIVASADRLASGFEREAFASYNAAADDDGRKLNHYTQRQWTLLEQIRLDGRAEPAVPDYRYPLAPLSPSALFPVPAADCETAGNAGAQAEYRALWQGFTAAIPQIPASHRGNLPLWLDHFDSLWQTYTHAIPSATTGGIRPEVSLYDHSRTAAALAVALWRYHADRNDDPATTRESLRAQWDHQRAAGELAHDAWESEKFLLIQGDFHGIQDFIFATGGETQKRAAKLLRGRSFQVSLLAELAALRVLEALDLPPTSQVVNAAGKFLIVAPNTPASAHALAAVQAEFDAWFLRHTHGRVGIGLARLPARADDFRSGTAGAASPFQTLVRRLFEQLEAVKLRRFGLCAEAPPPALFEDFLDAFHPGRGECRVDGRSPATVELSPGVWASALAADQIDIGHCLATQDRVLITREPLDHQTLRLDIFGYRIRFTRGEAETGRFGREARSGNLRRCWDFSLPEGFTDPLWNGYARRCINAYVPRFDDANAWDAELYRGLEHPGASVPHPDEPKTLNHLARDDRRLHEDGKTWVGQEALMTLKGDVDNLGTLFERGLERPTFAKWAALSRQVNAFFAVYLPWLCAHGEEDGIRRYRNTYTVFAGGDDFFLIGPWHSTLALAGRMRSEFARFVAGNPDIHFSAGLSMTKPGLPIRHLARLAETALEAAKVHQEPGPDGEAGAAKNAVAVFGQTVSWDRFDALRRSEARLARMARDVGLSTGYLYGLLQLTDMAAGIGDKPHNALWHAWFAYRTRRLVESRIRGGEDREAVERRRRALAAELATEIAREGIERFGAAYKIALFTYLYQQRD
ncbi:type III-A CRISPR-associated protein Cas10/Csm1 [Methyloparacoccus murrellii]